MVVLPLNSVSLSDLVEMSTKLAAAQLVLSILMEGGIHLKGTPEAMNALSNYQTLLETEATKRMKGTGQTDVALPAVAPVPASVS